MVSLTPQYKKVLQSEAPETLRMPKKTMFATEQAYSKAKEKFKQQGHWASEAGNLQDDATMMLGSLKKRSRM